MTTAAPGWLPRSHPGRRARPAPSPTTGVDRWARWTSVTCVALGCLAGWTAPRADAHPGWLWAVAAAGLVAGIPHGALDHLLAARLLRDRLHPRTGTPTSAVLVLAAASAGYAAVAAVTYVLFRLAPGPSLALFVVLSVLHFGAGETSGWGTGRWARHAGGVVVGALVLLVPLARDPGLTATVVSALAPGASLPAGWATAVLALVPPVAAVSALALAVTGRGRAAAEVAAFLVLVCTTPALLALAVYFGGWHAVRHTARLLHEDPVLSGVRRTRGTAAALTRFATLAALPTAVVLAGLAVLWAGAGGPVAALAATLPVLAAVTLPHSLVVASGTRRSMIRA